MTDKEVTIPYPPVNKDKNTVDLRVDNVYLNIFPAFIDYDFHKLRPRGLSCRIDFFSFGKLTQTVEDLKHINTLTFIKKSDFLFKGGFFLSDYKLLNENADNLIKNIRSMGFDTVYFEKSALLPIEYISEQLADVQFFIMEFF